jgi:hypothetical protein
VSARAISGLFNNSQRQSCGVSPSASIIAVNTVLALNATAAQSAEGISSSIFSEVGNRGATARYALGPVSR